MVAGLATPFVTGYQSFLVCRNSCHIQFSSLTKKEFRMSKARYTIHIVQS
jgi:hypothetical protein